MGRKLRHILAYEGYVFHSEATPGTLQAHRIEILGNGSNSGTQSGLNFPVSSLLSKDRRGHNLGHVRPRSDVSSMLLMGSLGFDELMLPLEVWEGEPAPTSALLTPLDTSKQQCPGG